MACNCICKTKYTRNAIRTFDYIERKSVQSFGASREKFQTMLHGKTNEDVQAIHYMIRPSESHPKSGDKDFLMKTAQAAADKLGRKKGYITRIALHSEKNFAAHQN
jgi:hypothetical protein